MTVLTADERQIIANATLTGTAVSDADENIKRESCEREMS